MSVLHAMQPQALHYLPHSRAHHGRVSCGFARIHSPIWSTLSCVAATASRVARLKSLPHFEVGFYPSRARDKLAPLARARLRSMSHIRRLAPL